MMDNSKVRCLKCNTRGVQAHGAVSEGGSRRYSPVLLRLIGCRCGIPCSFFFTAQKLDAFGELYEASPCVRQQEPRGQKTTLIPESCHVLNPPSLPNLSGTNSYKIKNYNDTKSLIVGISLFKSWQARDLHHSTIILHFRPWLYIFNPCRWERTRRWARGWRSFGFVGNLTVRLECYHTGPHIAALPYNRHLWCATT